MTNSADTETDRDSDTETDRDPGPDRIPGYDGGGPLLHSPELLDEPLFWLGHLSSCAQSEEAEELLFGADFEAAEDFYGHLLGLPGLPAFAVPLAVGRLYAVYRTGEGDAGTDYLLHHPEADRAELLARDDGHFMGPALSWPELVAVADGARTGGATDDPHARLLLLLPACGDAALPDGAAARVAAALRARTGVEAPDALAAVLLEAQGPCGPARWTTTDKGTRVNDGGHSYRNPANSFSLPPDRLSQVSAALDP